MLVVRVSEDITLDIQRNCTCYDKTFKEAATEQEYRTHLNAKYGIGFDSYTAISAPSGFILKHHDGLAGVVLPCSREEFDALTPSEKKGFVEVYLWGKSLLSNPSFNAKNATLLWAEIPYAVFEVEHVVEQTTPEWYKYAIAMDMFL